MEIVYRLLIVSMIALFGLFITRIYYTNKWENTLQIQRNKILNLDMKIKQLIINNNNNEASK